MDKKKEKVANTLRSSIEMYKKSIAEAEKKGKVNIAKHLRMEKELLEKDLQSLEKPLGTLVPKNEEKRTIESVTDEMYRNTINEMKKRDNLEFQIDLLERARQDTRNTYNDKTYKYLSSNRFLFKFRNIPECLVKSVEITTDAIKVRYYETEQFDVFGYFKNILSEATKYYDPLANDILVMRYIDNYGAEVRADKWCDISIKDVTTTERNYAADDNLIITEVVFGYKKAE